MITAVMMVRDEEDIIYYTLRQLLREGVDRVIVADNLSRDRTRGILDTMSESFPVTVVDDLDPAYYQSRKMTALVQRAVEDGTEWVVPVDADECWYCPDGPKLAEFFDAQPAGVGIVHATGWDQIVTPADGNDPNPYLRSPMRRENPQNLPKVAFRASPYASVHMGNHDVNGVSGRRVPGLALRQVQYRTLGQMTRKLRQGKAAYDLTDIHPMHGTHWREGGALTDAQLVEKWETLPKTNLVYDPVPYRSG